MNSLWSTKNRLYELIQLRRELQTEEAFTDMQVADRLRSIEEADKAIRAYVCEEVSANPNNIHQFLLESKARQEALAAEKKRLDGLLATEESEYERAKQLIAEVMREIGEKKLPVRGTLRLQANGGMQPVEVSQPELVPPELMRVSVTMSLFWWNAIRDNYGNEDGALKASRPEPDLTAIREVLLKREPCTACRGNGGVDLTDHGGGPYEPCPVCNGEKTVPTGVPGCRLLDRGEHLRIS
jgi:hypothetical protein